MNTKFGTNVPNRISLNTAKFQGYSFHRFWVIKGTPPGGGVKLLPPPSTPQIGVKNMFSLYGISKKWREWFSLTRNLIYISWNELLFLTTFLKQDTVTYVSLKGIIGFTFMKKWKIKAIVLSKSIIGSQYKDLGFTWLFYVYFAEQCVTLVLRFCRKLLWFQVLGRSQLSYHIYG